MKQLYHLPCNIAQTLNMIGEKWTLLILRQIMMGNRTYKEIQESLEGIPSNLLSDRLKSMEEDKLLVAEIYQQHPPRYHYVLTRSGEDLADIFYSLLIWGEKHVQDCDKQVVHTLCGHKVEHQYYCSHCNTIISNQEIQISDSM